MKPRFYLNNKKITKKKAMEMITKEALALAYEDFLEDPLTLMCWYIGEGVFEVRFEI